MLFHILNLDTDWQTLGYNFRFCPKKWKKVGNILYAREIFYEWNEKKCLKKAVIGEDENTFGTSEYIFSVGNHHTISTQNKRIPYILVKKSNTFSDRLGAYALCDFKDQDLITFAIAEEITDFKKGEESKDNYFYFGFSFVNGMHGNDPTKCNAFLTKDGLIRATKNIQSGEEIIYYTFGTFEYNYLDILVRPSTKVNRNNPDHFGTVTSFQKLGADVKYTITYLDDKEEEVDEDELNTRMIFGNEEIPDDEDSTEENSDDEKMPATSETKSLEILEHDS